MRRCDDMWLTILHLQHGFDYWLLIRSCLPYCVQKASSSTLLCKQKPIQLQWGDEGHFFFFLSLVVCFMDEDEYHANCRLDENKKFHANANRFMYFLFFGFIASFDKNWIHMFLSEKMQTEASTDSTSRNVIILTGLSGRDIQLQKTKIEFKCNKDMSQESDTLCWIVSHRQQPTSQRHTLQAHFRCDSYTDGSPIPMCCWICSLSLCSLTWILVAERWCRIGNWIFVMRLVSFNFFLPS